MTELGHKFGLTTPKARITNFRHNASSTMMIKMQHCTYMYRSEKPCLELTFTNGSKFTYYKMNLVEIAICCNISRIGYYCLKNYLANYKNAAQRALVLKHYLRKQLRKKENKPNFGVGGATRKIDPAPLSQQLDTKNYPCVLFIGKISDQIPLSLCWVVSLSLWTSFLPSHFLKIN